MCCRSLSWKGPPLPSDGTAPVPGPGARISFSSLRSGSSGTLAADLRAPHTVHAQSPLQIRQTASEPAPLGVPILKEHARSLDTAAALALAALPARTSPLATSPHARSRLDDDTASEAAEHLQGADGHMRSAGILGSGAVPSGAAERAGGTPSGGSAQYPGGGIRPGDSLMGGSSCQRGPAERLRGGITSSAPHQGGQQERPGGAGGDRRMRSGSIASVTSTDVEAEAAALMQGVLAPLRLARFSQVPEEEPRPVSAPPGASPPAAGGRGAHYLTIV